MVQMFKELFIETIEDGEYLIGFAMWVVLLSLLSLFMVLSICVVDGYRLLIKEDEGTVIGVNVKPEYHYNIYINVGKSLIPVARLVGEEYAITVKINSSVGEITISKSEFDYIQIKDKVYCKFSKGRISNDLQLISIKKNF